MPVGLSECESRVPHRSLGARLVSCDGLSSSGREMYLAVMLLLRHDQDSFSAAILRERSRRGTLDTGLSGLDLGGFQATVKNSVQGVNLVTRSDDNRVTWPAVSESS
jgi:hypothetical protein